jgi:MFS superfamily sulfate permease-like transporter
MAIILFLREQIGGSVVRHKFYVNQRSSNWHRSETERHILEHKGTQGVIFELQGSLFFGTTQQLLELLDPELKVRNFVILDMKRVQSVDVTQPTCSPGQTRCLSARRCSSPAAGTCRTAATCVNFRTNRGGRR